MMMWLDNLITTGIQQLLVLRLKNPPAMDSISSLVLLWIQLFKRQPIDWDEQLDAPRIKEAFFRCMSSVDSFPTPRQVLDLLPARPQLLKLEHNKHGKMPDNIKTLLKDAIEHSATLTNEQRRVLIEREQEKLNQLIAKNKISGTYHE